MFNIRNSNKKEEDFIIEELVKYNFSKVPSNQKENFIWINKVVENHKGEIIAGILSKMYAWNCLYIDLLWVNEANRKIGLGSKLLKIVEDQALDKGCRLIHLDTFDFQGKDFYLKYGYEVFGVLDECPENHKRYFLKKSLE